MTSEHTVFVYGTLKRGNRTRGLDSIPGAQFVGAATTAQAEFTLWDLGAYPAAQMGGHNRIQGEVWQVNDQVFQMLDDIEGYPVFYSRAQINTTQGPAWIYHIPDIQDYTGAEPVQGTQQPEATVEWNPKHTPALQR